MDVHHSQGEFHEIFRYGKIRVRKYRKWDLLMVRLKRSVKFSAYFRYYPNCWGRNTCR